MKNLHILPTDKPSRFTFRKDYKYYRFRKDEFVNNDTYQNQHIYITNDEEIKEGDYFWKPDCNMIFKAEYTPHKGCKKIILTTDQDLNKDGVQPIDDEFLEWFVKNPSCEEVEVESLNIGEDKLGYIICKPKEEPKQEEPKQETLEEARKYAELSYYGDEVDVFVNGAKWQQEKMYSEEDMLQALNIGFTSTDETWEECVEFAKEQFKKK